MEYTLFSNRIQKTNIKQTDIAIIKDTLATPLNKVDKSARKSALLDFISPLTTRLFS